MMMMKKKKKKSVICMFCLLLLLLAISRAESINCTRRCGDVDIPFPFGIEPDCFLPGYHVVCNSSKLYSGDIQIQEIDPNKSRAEILQKITLVDPQNNTNNSTGVHISTEMNLTGSPFRFSESRNIFAAVGCNVIAFFNTSIPGTVSDSTGYGHSCAALCNDVNYTHLNGTCSGADGCCQITNFPREAQQLTSSLILDSAGFSGSSSQNSHLYSFIASQSFFINNYSSSDLRGRDVYEQFQGQVPVSVDWSITNASCNEAKLNPTNYACRSRNSECYQPYSFRGYTCSCRKYYEGNPYKEDGCSVRKCPKPGCYGVCLKNGECLCPPDMAGGDPFNPMGCGVEVTPARNIFMIISASVGGCVLILFAVIVLSRSLKKKKSPKQKEEILS